MAHLIKTPHPVTLEGQEHIPVQLRPGESLFSLLSRSLGEQLDGELWNVSVAGVEVPRERWHDCYPKDGQVIECTGDVGRSALYLVAVVALTIWTGGMFASVAAGGSVAGLGTVASYAAIAGIQIAGSLLINKVLGPKAPGSPDSSQAPTSYSLTNTSNQMRQYGAVPILFGRMRVTPDLLSKVYNYFDNNDMYLAMHLSWGIGVGRIETLYNGDTPMASYDNSVQTWNAGFAAMPENPPPLFGATSSQPGGSLQENEHTPLVVQRTTAPETARVLLNISGQLYGTNRKGKVVVNNDTFAGQYRKVGDVGWTPMFYKPLQNSDRRTLRFTIPFDFPEVGQYEVSVTRYGLENTGNGDVCQFSLDSIVSIQKDTSDYDGIARTGLTLRANERLASTPSEVNGFAYAAAIPVWKGDRWVTEETSNPGAQMLKYIRGYYSPKGELLAGMGLDDDEIDIAAFQAFMLHCAQNQFEYNFWLTQDRDHLNVLNTIAGAAMGQFVDANGRHSVTWVAEDQAVDGTVNMARIKRGTFRVDYSLISTADGVVARYWDLEQNKEAVLRVPMPGVQTMLSPAQVTLEGVTSEAQAALLARYYLAQSLYQFKDIGFGVSLENLTFRRLSLLQMQHDLTQWGYGGAVVKVDTVGTRLQLTLDEPVPPPRGQQAYIGIRVPGQRAAAVLRVKNFTEATNVITLDEAWPAGLDVPGNRDDNPAHDSIWIYDFKETPGLTVRVTSIQRAADRSASVSVVPESAQFWTYVKTGAYEPANSGSLLRTRPVINDLAVTEQQNVIGDVVQDQLAVSFSVEGPYDRARVYTTVPGGELQLRAETLTREAVFDIAGPGEYTVTVIPYNAQGLRGTAKSVVFTTKDAGKPPVLVDTFDVEQLSGGVRFYTWGFYADTIQSADFAGVEIRYMAGEDVSAYDWDTMTPLGDTGYHTVPFEAVVPVAGKYVFAARSRNAAGVLSTTARVIAKELSANLGEVINKIRDDGQQSFEELDNEIKQVQAGLIEEAQQREAAVRQESLTREQAVLQLQTDIAKNAQDLLNEELARTAAITNEQTLRQNADESLALQISQLSAGTGDQFDSDRIWYFDTGAEGWPGTVTSGWLDPGGPAVSPALQVDGDRYRYVKARLRRVGTPITWQGKLAWTAQGGGAGEVTLTEPTWDGNGVGTLDVHDIPWSGTITGITLTLGEVTNSSRYEYDWIAVGRPTPGASVAMVEREASARAAADAVEATSRETLAVQLRGSYEGTDAAQLTTGLIHSESNLRIAGDVALGTRIDSMQVQIGDNRAAITEEATVRAAADQVNADAIQVVSSRLSDKADATVVQDLTTRVTETEGKVTAQATQLQRLDVQLYGPHAGDQDDYAGDPEIAAGTLTAYSAMATADNALSSRIDVVNAQFGDFSSVVREEVRVLTNAQSAQATALQQLRSDLAGKASAQAVNTLSTSVEQLGQQTLVNAQNIQSVSASVAGKADGSVVQQMSVQVVNNTGQVAQINSRYFLGVQSNGLIGGMYVGNNGQLVNVRFQSDKFTIEAPSGTNERFEYSNGSIKIYDNNNVLRVQLGVGF